MDAEVLWIGGDCVADFEESFARDGRGEMRQDFCC